MQGLTWISTLSMCKHRLVCCLQKTRNDIYFDPISVSDFTDQMTGEMFSSFCHKQPSLKLIGGVFKESFDSVSEKDQSSDQLPFDRSTANFRTKGSVWVSCAFCYAVGIRATVCYAVLFSSGLDSYSRFQCQ